MHVNVQHCDVVLNQPGYPENIGAAARCCRNMGMGGMAVVRPRLWDMQAILKMATHESADIVKNMPVYDNLEEALAPYSFVAGTTARTGRQRRPTHTPKSLAESIAPISRENRVAILFGSEKYGLSNRDLSFCQCLVHIPTAQFSSVNLAQSVMIVCYELFMTTVPATYAEPRLATTAELQGMFDHIGRVCLEIGFINHENPDYWMNNIRRFLSRMRLRSRETRMIRGFCRQLLWRLDQCGKGPKT